MTKMRKRPCTSTGAFEANLQQTWVSPASLDALDTPLLHFVGVNLRPAADSHLRLVNSMEKLSARAGDIYHGPSGPAAEGVTTFSHLYFLTKKRSEGYRAKPH